MCSKKPFFNIHNTGWITHAQVHPDKNCHPGATEAMKRLNDAYQRLTKGEATTGRVLPVGKSAAGQEGAGGKPPKVISVKTQR